MTIHTMPWTSSGDGDGPSAGHGVELARRMFRNLWLYDATVQGVAYKVANQLAASHSAPSEIDVATGAALVYGTHVNNDAVVTVTLAGVAADTAGIITIGMDWTGGITGTAQTGFIRAVQQTSGNTSFPSPTQSDLTSWEIEIARYIVDSSGNVFTSAAKTTAGPLDTRRFIGQVLEVSRQGGSATTWPTVGTTDYENIPAKIQVGSVQWTGAAAGSGQVDVTFPEAFAAFPIVFAQENGQTSPSMFFSAGALGADTARIYWHHASLTNLTSVNILWLAIGKAA